MVDRQKQESNRRYYERNRDVLNARRRNKYSGDPEYRGSALLKAKTYREENPGKVVAYREANKERRNAQSKDWRESNSKRVKEYLEQYRKENQESIKKYNRDYYQKNSDVAKMKSQQWREENPEMVALQGRRYRKEKASKIYSKNAQRRALLKGAKVERVDYDIIYLRDNGICGICENGLLREDMTLDHIVPLSRGGEHSAINVQVAHLSCNSKKGMKTMQEMALA